MTSRRTIDKIQDNTEFYWRYQRYSFVREYLERPPFAYPPLILLTHIFFLFRLVKRLACPKVCHNAVGTENQSEKLHVLTCIFSKNETHIAVSDEERPRKPFRDDSCGQS